MNNLFGTNGVEDKVFESKYIQPGINDVKIVNFEADNSRFGVVLSEEMKNHHVSGSDLMYYAGMHKENIFAI